MATVIATMVFMTACGGNKEEATTLSLIHIQMCIRDRNKTKKVASKYYVFDKKGKAIPRSLARYQAYITLKKITNSKDSKMTKIRKAYSYVVRSSSYRIKPRFVQPSAANWVEAYGYNTVSYTHLK